MPLPSDHGFWVMVLVGLAFSFMGYRRSIRGIWKDVTGPHWFGNLLGYGLLFGAMFLFIAFYGAGRHTPALYPRSVWRPAALVGSIVTFAASIFVFVKIDGLIRIRRRKKLHASAEHERKMRAK
jgi:hypothetical protein